jgi:hypothetical protein
MLPVQRAGLTFTPSDALLLGGARVSRIRGKIDTWVTDGPMRWRHGAAIIGGRRLGMPLAEVRARSRVFVSLLVFEPVGLGTSLNQLVLFGVWRMDWYGIIVK